METSTGAAGGSDAVGCQPPATAAGDGGGDPQSRPPGRRVDFDTHAKEMLALPVDILEADFATLPGWHPCPVRPSALT